MGKNNKKNGAAAVRTKKVDPLILGTLVFAVVVLAALITLCVYRNSDAYLESQPAITIGDNQVTATEYAYYYNNSVNSFLSSNSSYLSYMGLDLQKPLSSQTCALDQSKTWAQYFESMVDETITQAEILYAEGKKAGFAPEDLQSRVDEAMEELKHHAEEHGNSFEEDMKEHYGRKYSEEEIRAIVEKGEYTTLYREKVLEESSATEEEQNAYYEENKDNYWRVTYRTESFPFSTTGEENTDTKEVAKQKADEMLATVTDEASFIAQAKSKYTEEKLAAKAEDFTLRADPLRSSLTDAVKNWMSDAARQPGDKTVIESTSSYDVVYYVTTWLDDYKTADIRLIYLPVETESDATDEEKQAARDSVSAKANELFGQWNTGEKTEENFIALAKANSKDRNAETGSLYEDVNKSSFATDLTDWIFAAERAAGDSQMIQTSSASYIVYYVAQGEEYWKQSVEAAVKQNNYDSWYEAMKNNYPVTKNSDILGKAIA